MKSYALLVGAVLVTVVRVLSKYFFSFKLLNQFQLDAEAPLILPFQNASPLEENSRYTALCSTSRGSTPLVFTWFKDGNLIPELTDSVKVEKASLSATLAISKVSRYDAGNYSCSVQNAFGKDTKGFYLPVIVPMRWIIEPKDATVKTGEKVTISCEAEGSPYPKSMWYSTQSGKLVSSSGHLVFERISKKDSGTYECISFGATTNLTKKVAVKVKGRLVNSAHLPLDSKVVKTECGAFSQGFVVGAYTI